MTTADLWIDVNPTNTQPGGPQWRLTLKIPTEDLIRMAKKPVKWLRFAGFSMTGTDGHLYMNENCDPAYLANQETEIPPNHEILAGEYWFKPKGNIFLVDVDGMDHTRSEFSTESTGSRTNFRKDLVKRDGNCVAVGTKMTWCEAAHMIPKVKGHEYIKIVTRMRGPQAAELPETGGSQETTSSLTNSLNTEGGQDPPHVIRDINDIRNGLILDQRLHTSQGLCQVMFLETPNAVLSVEDVSFIPNTDKPILAADAPRRITMQWLSVSDAVDSKLPETLEGLDIQQPDDLTARVSQVVLEFGYGVALLKAWSPVAFKDEVRERTSGAYNNSVHDNSDESDVSTPDANSSQPQAPGSDGGDGGDGHNGGDGGGTSNNTQGGRDQGGQGGSSRARRSGGTRSRGGGLGGHGGGGVAGQGKQRGGKDESSGALTGPRIRREPSFDAFDLALGLHQLVRREVVVKAEVSIKPGDGGIKSWTETVDAEVE